VSLTKERSPVASFQKFAAGFEIVPEDFAVRPITTGFLHRSYCLTHEKNGAKYVLQRLSPIFDLQAINTNLNLFEKAQAKSHSFLPEYWQKVYYLDVSGSKNKIYYDEERNAWRAMVHVPGEIRVFNSFNEVPEGKKEEVAYSLGEAIAIFGKILATKVDQGQWQEPLPNFHDPVYHYKYLQSILNKEEVPLSLSHDKRKKVRLDGKLKEDEELKDRCGRLVAKIDRMGHLVSALDDLGTAVTHGDLKINNAVFRRDKEGKWRCVALIDLDTIQRGGVLDDLGDALRSAGNPAGEQPASLDLVTIDKLIVQRLIDGFIDKTAEFYDPIRAEELRKYTLKAYAQFLYVQAIRFFADFLVGNRYFKLKEGERGDLNLYRAEVQMKALEELEKL